MYIQICYFIKGFPLSP